MLGFNILTILITAFLPFFTFDRVGEIKFQIDIAISSTFILGILTTIYHASTSITEEVDDRTIFSVLSKPVHNHSFIFGNFLGLLAVLFTFFSIGVFLTDISAYLGEFRMSDSKSSFFTVIYSYLTSILSLDFGVSIFPYFFISFLSGVILLSISVSISPFCPFLLNLSFCGTLYALGNLLPSLDIFSELPWLLISQIPPRLDLFNMSDALVIGREPGTGMIALSIMYALTYSAVWLALGSALLGKKEFT